MTPLLRSFSAALLALVCACVLSSCLEGYEEEMVINSDLSGRAVVKVSLPDSISSKFDAVGGEFTQKKIEQRFASLSGVTLERYNLSEGRYPVATFEVAFTSLDALAAAAAANPPAQMLVGGFVIKQDEEGRTIIERTLGNGTATAALPSDKFAQFKTHFQTPVEISNTDSGFKDTAHNDVRYRWSLADIAARKPSMVNKLEKPLPWLWILGGAGAFLLITWVCWLTLGQKKVVLPAPRAQRREDAEES